jgi:hypothetical protein
MMDKYNITSNKDDISFSISHNKNKSAKLELSPMKFGKKEVRPYSSLSRKVDNKYSPSPIRHMKKLNVEVNVNINGNR